MHSQKFLRFLGVKDQNSYLSTNTYIKVPQNPKVFLVELTAEYRYTFVRTGISYARALQVPIHHTLERCMHVTVLQVVANRLSWIQLQHGLILYFKIKDSPGTFWRRFLR